MTDATLQGFRDIADQMIGRADWEWIGPHMSQRMFGITRERAEAYAKAHGGVARRMINVEALIAADTRNTFHGGEQEAY